MTTPHKWADVIKAWADGKPIQLSNGIRWEDVSVDNSLFTPSFHHGTAKWRIKPKTVKYRRYLRYSAGGVPVVNIVHQPYSDGSVEGIWKNSFIRWIDNDWQEVEV